MKGAANIKHLNIKVSTKSEYQIHVVVFIAGLFCCIALPCRVVSVYVAVSGYFLGSGIQEPGWNVFAVLMGSLLISCLPKLVLAAWPLAKVLLSLIHI